ncbi:unnamed protein product [Symbiodinium sp. CCMP2592]|nr:unnamed protein product [Symbiodinium sp. CCMP2592]
MSWKTWQSTSWASNSHSSNNNSWTTSGWQTPEKRKSEWSEQQQWDYGSPTGVPFVEGLPDEFKPDKTHLDTKEIYGKTMLRRVAATSWATKYRLAGRELADLRVTDLVWKGWRNNHLRALSHGQYVSVVIARRVSESVLTSQFLSSVRESRWDLDEVSAEYCRQNPDKVSIKSSMSSDEVKAARTLALSNHIIDTLRPFAGSASGSSSFADQSQRIADLQAQLEPEKAKNSTSNPAAMNQPPAKRMRLCSKTAAINALPIQAPVADPTQELVDKALDPDAIINSRVLHEIPTQGVAKSNISKWLKNVKSKVGPEKAQTIEKALELSQQLHAQLDPMVVQRLRDKCAQIGLPVQWATKIKEPEIYQGGMQCYNAERVLRSAQVYEQLNMYVSQASVFLQESTKRSFLNKYKWGINLRTSSLPIAYLLFKRKKQYRVARPIISYSFFVYARLFRATSIVLDLLIRDVCPLSFGLATLPQMLGQLTAFMQQLPDDFSAEVHNQDLIGFFTSIPVQRILDSVGEVVQRYVRKHRADITQDVFSVRLDLQDSKLRVWKGRPRKGAQKTYLVYLQDIVAICRLSCECSVFTVMGKVFRQQRGATIGNQISPMLANLTVSLLEQRYMEEHQHVFRRVPHFYCVRYVDNRLLICSADHSHYSVLQHLFSDMFYESPVELEQVISNDADQEFLGFDFISVESRLHLLIRDEPWKIRLPQSAGPLHQKLAAFTSKKLSILRHVWPPEDRVDQLRLLTQLFLKADFDPALLR